MHIRNRKICMVMALLILGGGFLGISNYSTEERLIDLTEEKGNEVSLDMLVQDGPENKGEKISEDDESSADLEIAARSAVLIDADSGSVLFSQNENKRLPPASVTKVMTMLLALEAVDSGKISLEDKVTISERASGMGGSQMYMETGEEHKLEEIMKGIAMVSANDGCVAAAEYVAGSEEIFVEEMNRRASELGMKNTHFVNTNGLPAADHYSSAYDIALMSRELLKHMDGRTWFTTWQDNIKVGLPGKRKDFGLTNTNKLIKEYKGAIGIKTGFTSEAGYCLSGAASRDDTTLIAVVMGCETSDIRLREIKKMLDHGFALYETYVIAEKDEDICKAEFPKGTPEMINGIPECRITALLKKGEKNDITYESILSEDIALPLKKGDRIGRINVMKSGKKVAEYNIEAEEAVDRAGIYEIYKRAFLKLAK